MTTRPTASKVLLLVEGRTTAGAGRPMRVKRYRLARLAPILSLVAEPRPDRRHV